MQINTTTLSAITDFAARTIPIREFASKLELTDPEWKQLLRHPEVQLAISRGRSIAQIEVNRALMRCVKNGKSQAALLMLQLAFGWPQPKRGRPPRVSAPMHGQR